MNSEDNNHHKRQKNVLADIFNKKNNPVLSTIDDFFQRTNSYFLPYEWVETKTHLIIEAKLPGVSRDEIDLDLLRDHLRIQVNQKEEKEDLEGSRKRELRYERVISLPANISLSGMKAMHRDGVLKVKFPKIKGKKIDIE